MTVATDAAATVTAIQLVASDLAALQGSVSTSLVSISLALSSGGPVPPSYMAALSAAKTQLTTAVADTALALAAAQVVAGEV